MESTGETKTRLGLEFFDAKPQVVPEPVPGSEFGSAEMTYRSGMDKQIFEGMAGVMFSNQRVSPCARFDGSGLNLIVYDWGPGWLLPLHSHSVDCLYYIESGQIEMGNRKLGPGQGFLVPANHPYGYRVGVDGARVIEFRATVENKMSVLEHNLAGWKDRFMASINRATSVKRATEHAS